MGQKEDLEELKETVRVHDIQLNGNPENPKDFGVTGEVAVLLAIKKQLWKWISILIAAGLMWTSIYFINAIKDDTRNDNANGSGNNSHFMDNPNEHSGGGKDNGNSNNRSNQHGH